MRTLVTTSLLVLVASAALAQDVTYDLPQARRLVEEIGEMSARVAETRAEEERPGGSASKLRCLVRNETALNGFLQLAEESVTEIEANDAAARNASSTTQASAAREMASQRFELVQISHTRALALEQLAAQCVSGTVTAEGEIVRTAEIDPFIDEILAGTFGDPTDLEWLELIDSLIEESSPYL